MSSNLIIKSLNGLRGIAVLIVIFSHTGNSGLYLLPNLNLTGTGQYGVILFFFLSSFLLSRPFFHDPELIFSARKWINYFIRRIIRILPLYYTVILIDFYYLKAQIVSPDKQELIDHLLFIRGNGVYWSVPVELKFYLILPLFVVALVICSRNKLALWSILTLITCLFVSNGLLAYTNSFWETLFIHRYVVSFIAGILTSYIYVLSEKMDLQLFKKGTFEIIAILCIVVMGTQIPAIWYYFQGGHHFNYSSIDWGQYYKYRHLLAISCFSILTYSYLNGTGIIKKLLSASILRSCGELSFSMYLLHMPVLYFVVNHFQGTSLYIMTGLIFVLTYLVSFLTYRIIEKPFMDLTKTKSSVNLPSRKQLDL
ncbi:acyltransferase family protein [Candidatus Pristimantibacillus sp. PTI5]|uniref:acyltransferase family protein n=1 Tax=Candidatus Pristimantibacillus sp. PTI5 TaxID=3400422 RepID=UPI003B02DFBD